MSALLTYNIFNFSLTISFYYHKIILIDDNLICCEIPCSIQVWIYFYDWRKCTMIFHWKEEPCMLRIIVHYYFLVRFKMCTLFVFRLCQFLFIWGMLFSLFCYIHWIKVSLSGKQNWKSDYWMVNKCKEVIELVLMDQYSDPIDKPNKKSELDLSFRGNWGFFRKKIVGYF